MSKQYVLAAWKSNRVLVFIKIRMTTAQREVILPLCSTLLRPHLEYCIRLWRPQHKRDIDLLEKFRRTAVEMMRGLKHLSCEERLKKLELFSLKKRRLQSNLIASFENIKGAEKKDEDIIIEIVATEQVVTILN